MCSCDRFERRRSCEKLFWAKKICVLVTLQLAAKSDVFIENFIPGKLAEVGLGYEELKGINPRLIYCSLTGA